MSCETSATTHKRLPIMTRSKKRQRVDESGEDAADSSHPQSFEEKYETHKKTPQEKKAWTSKVYDHFKYPVIEIQTDGSVKYRFICKTNPSQSCAYLGRLHIGFDGWTSPNVKLYLGVVVNYADKGKLLSFILDFITLKASHTGKYLAEELEKCLRKYGIAEKILGQACDNATNNDTLLAELEFRIPSGAHGTHTRIRCICHILNLVVKAILFVKKKKGKGGKSTKDDEDDEDDDVPDQEELQAAAAVDPDREAHDEEEIEKLSERISLEELTDEEIAIGKKALDKV
ncbi:hypothetical protein CVT26_013046 [Gymnopilus dilepis]|uniref:DUF659 domain-containing protein n=1 Tax=Gymnopilus dilepis TaxID=231916 RepID=A0A409X0I6_9AGAR|nr:hypothetical protein CVT26_013046 [Gymnopilus dilepis]